MKILLYNTMGREVQEFKPIEDGLVKMYTCGPTVYNFAHIGNLRTYVFEDVLRRVFEYAGFKVEHVMNITDVGHLTDDADEGEDKMEKSSRESGKSVWEIAKYYTDAFFRDTDRLNIIRPTIAPRATEHIDDMIALIKRLEEGGHTYQAGGNVYFSIDTFPDYGRLALLDRQDLQAGARIEVDSNKRNPHDFVLWFTNSKFENHAMLWDSPWGKGYPGWHIECSAMSIRYLGEQFDIHCGGVDHIPVHHTNEIAQAEAATGKQWVQYWVHGEFLLMNKGKMAKSAGNFLTLQSLVDKGYHPLDYRYFCLGGHYRSQLQFSFESLDAAKSARERLVSRIAALREGLGDRWKEAIVLPPSAAGSKILERFEAAVGQDMNMPKALAELWQLLKSELQPGEKLSVVSAMDRVLGLNLLALPQYAIDSSKDGEIEELIKQRNAARSRKDFRLADEIRDKLSARGISIKDTPNGTKWSRTL
ncbi:cysteine--tRNA ligase [Sediminispirochaeta bajacaliforniensis]|uniref:cysteine--tRNA ligase n=1 Tax=Sediminispirochaeta bajacaliforniensis TaxID=148 RepID=UPI000372D66A|nr:cysteine--tRNA ligase [Sediminispirochaeta bajacaliforniensis]